MKAVILAGGKGRRLHPYTTNFPKPLMPIGEKPILEIVIQQLKQAGFKHILIATGHLEELIRAYFQDGTKQGVQIDYSKEEEPLGTAGPLNLLRDQLTETFLLMNGDVLSDLDFSKFLEFHRNQGSTATVALSRRQVEIDFGVVHLTNEQGFSRWEEKPVIPYLVSTGIYLFEPQALDYLPPSSFFNLPDLIVKLHENQQKVACYIHEGEWLDIGRGEDYEKACRDFGDLHS